MTVEWALTLSDELNGINCLIIKDHKVISSTGMNLPNAEIFRQVFTENDIEFSLKEPVFYERIQVGATVNPPAGEIELIIDNFSLIIE